MLDVVLPFLAAFPHILKQDNTLLPQSVCSLDFPWASLVSIWIQSCHDDAVTAVVISTAIMSGLILLVVSAAPPSRNPSPP